MFLINDELGTLTVVPISIGCMYTFVYIGAAGAAEDDQVK
jgi:hypothetical protein